MAQGGSKLAVAAAVGGNTLVMIAKFTAFAVTGSGSMFSEGIHTLADVLNQVLLLIGIVRSEHAPDEEFPYGYAAERYVFALISAVGIFFLGCGVTVYHGISQLLHHKQHPDNLGWAIGVLAASFVIEGIVLVLAVRTVHQAAAGKPFLRYLFKEADPAAAAVVLEDAAACLGVLIAGGAILMAKFTGQYYWDAFGSLAIGLLLGAIATYLIVRNRTILMGPGVPLEVHEHVKKLLEQNPTVEEVVDLRTRMLDVDTYRIKADIHFNGEALAKKLSAKLEAAYPEIKSYEDFEKFAAEYAEQVVELLADEINDIEAKIQKKYPQARHLDLEAD